MRRRREDVLRETISDTLKAEGKGLLGALIGLFLKKLVEIIIKALRKEPWIDLDSYEGDEY